MTLQTENKQAETSVINNPSMGICLAERAIFFSLNSDYSNHSELLVTDHFLEWKCWQKKKLVLETGIYHKPYQDCDKVIIP